MLKDSRHFEIVRIYVNLYNWFQYSEIKRKIEVMRTLCVCVYVFVFVCVLYWFAAHLETVINSWIQFYEM